MYSEVKYIISEPALCYIEIQIHVQRNVKVKNTLPKIEIRANIKKSMPHV